MNNKKIHTNNIANYYMSDIIIYDIIIERNEIGGN